MAMASMATTTTAIAKIPATSMISPRWSQCFPGSAMPAFELVSPPYMVTLRIISLPAALYSPEALAADGSTGASSMSTSPSSTARILSPWRTMPSVEMRI